MSYAPADWWPEARKRPVRWAASTHPWAAPPLGWILHVVVGNGSPFATFHNSTSPNRRFSHWWVAKDGTCEQYAPASVTSWAQGAGNGTYWSVETEGMPAEPLTDAQLDTLARLHRWLGAADHIATSPTDAGISCHFVGGQAWGGHTCPDPAPGAGPRSHQRAEIIRRAQTGADDMQLSKDDINAVRDAILQAPYGNRTLAQVLSQVSIDSASAAKNSDPATLAPALAKLLAGAIIDPAALATALVTQLGTGLAGALADELAKRLVR